MNSFSSANRSQVASTTSVASTWETNRKVRLRRFWDARRQRFPFAHCTLLRMHLPSVGGCGTLPTAVPRPTNTSPHPTNSPFHWTFASSSRLIARTQRAATGALQPFGAVSATARQRLHCRRPRRAPHPASRRRTAQHAAAPVRVLRPGRRRPRPRPAVRERTRCRADLSRERIRRGLVLGGLISEYKPTA